MSPAQIIELLPHFFVVWSLSTLVVTVISLWFIFKKVGKPGWVSIIPLYNLYVLVRVVGSSWWVFILLLVPYIGVLVFVFISIELAKCFGRGTLFGIGIGLMTIFFLPIVAFDKSSYEPLNSTDF
jgi:hypothetical protein